MLLRLLIITFFAATTVFSQIPAIEPGVSHELAKWRAARYSDVRYKLNLTLEKMSPVLKGTIEIRVKVGESRSGGVGESEPGAIATGSTVPIILDWRTIAGHDDKSTISNVTINGRSVVNAWTRLVIGGGLQQPPSRTAKPSTTPEKAIQAASKEEVVTYLPQDEHLIFKDGVVAGENVIKLDFTSPILTSGSAITRYVDKEDGAEYIYSLFVPSDASTAFPVFDQPDLKARFSLIVTAPTSWRVVSNSGFADGKQSAYSKWINEVVSGPIGSVSVSDIFGSNEFAETKPISTYVFAFAAGPFEEFSDTGGNASVNERAKPGIAMSGETKVRDDNPGTLVNTRVSASNIFVRRSQAAKFKPHAAEVFRLNREGIKYLETYFDYKFPFPKYDIVLIPEFPFGWMEHAGATFLREASVIFPQEPTKNDYISRANVIFHEAAHQWFGDTVTMKWFDDLWLKEGFAEFMAYKTLEHVQGGNPTGREGAPRVKGADQMPEVNAWKVFYERNKQAAYFTDSTKGTTPIYQEIANLNSAKSAYGNIVYRKAPSFLKQAEFYLGPEKFQTAVRAFLKKHEYANAGWEDLVKEFEAASGKDLGGWAERWVLQKGMPIIRMSRDNVTSYCLDQSDVLRDASSWPMKIKVLQKDLFGNDRDFIEDKDLFGAPKSDKAIRTFVDKIFRPRPLPVCAYPWSHAFVPPFIFPNYQDYGYGIFLLDDKSRDYVLKNIQNEKDDFLRTMMWGSLWDSVREGELDPKEYVELVIKNIKPETDESTVQTLLGHVSTAMKYYLPDEGGNASVNERAKPGITNSSGTTPRGANVGTLVNTRVSAALEALLIDRMQNASTPGLQLTYYRAFLSIASSENATRIMRVILKGSEPGAVATGFRPSGAKNPVATAPGSDRKATTKDKFDIVSRLIILGDPDALKLLADLEKTETSDEAKRYAYAAKAGFTTAGNKAKYWNEFINNKDISESWIEAAFGPFNATRHADLTLPYLERALAELPNLKRSRKIFFVNGWLGAFIGGQRSEEALNIINKFLANNPNLDKDLRLKILENSDLIERAVKIRNKYGK